MPSSDPRNYARFIPAEELGDVSAWRFGQVGATYSPAELDVRKAEAAAVEVRVQAVTEDAFARGLAQGRAEATAEGEIAAQAMLQAYIDNQGRENAERLAQVVVAAQASLREAEAVIAQGVLDLSCAIARQVLRRELTTEPGAVRHVVKEALELVLADARAATVRLHPQDLAQLHDGLRDEFAANAVQVLPDASIAPGGCRIESAGTVIDGSLMARWNRAVSALGLPTARASLDEPESAQSADASAFI